MNHQQPTKQSSSGNPNKVELRNINQSYDNGKTWIIKDLNFIIEDIPNKGEFICLLGASGCGKSTILRYISGLQEPTSGEILIKDIPRSDQNRVGMVFQQYSSLPWLTVLENVELGLKFQGMDSKTRKKRALEMISIVGLEGHEEKFAMYPILSGGQLQRVAIARSLLASPDILLMDEPFGALDIKTRLQMQDLLTSIWANLQTTVIFVTHDISEAVYLGDFIWIMKSRPGQIIHQFKVDLPYERNRSVKRSDYFFKLTHKIEDIMMDIEGKEE